MTFIEMREKYDKYNAFHNYLTVNQAKVMELIPEDFLEYFPDYCECGSENIITTDLTIIECCDPRCPIKQAFGLHNLFSRFSCKGIGESICKRAYDMVYNKNKALIESGKEPILQTDSYVELLLLDESVYLFDFLNSADGNSMLHYVDIIKHTEVTFPELVGKLGLPELDTTAYTLFDGINSFTELREQIIADGGVSNFCAKRRYYDPMKSFWLYVSLQDIYVASCVFDNVRNLGLVTQQVCITGSLHPNGNRVTKKDFLSICNRLSIADSNSNLLKRLLEEKGSSWYCENSDKIVEAALDFGIQNLPNGNYEECLDFLDNYEDSPRCLLETQMNQAKETVPYIIADSPSNSAKYLAGVRRGVEKNHDGSERKVLISSEEYMNILKEMVREWEQRILKSMLQKIVESDNQNSSLEKMNCF